MEEGDMVIDRRIMSRRERKNENITGTLKYSMFSYL
jgi:hypothetical protein